MRIVIGECLVIIGRICIQGCVVISGSGPGINDGSSARDGVPRSIRRSVNRDAKVLVVLKATITLLFDAFFVQARLICDVLNGVAVKVAGFGTIPQRQLIEQPIRRQ